MNKILLSSLLSLVALASSSAELSKETLARSCPIKKAPVIDGKNSVDEWKYAVNFHGGVSPYTKLMTYRYNDFKVSYNEKGFYFAVISETPRLPQQLTGDDKIEIRLQAPGSASPVVIRFDSTGKGSYPKNVVIANGLAPDLLNSFRGKCWISEVFVPAEVLKVKSIADNQTWGLQMIRYWSNQKEVGYLHYSEKGNELATFITDKSAPAVSFDGFGHEGFKTTYHCRFSYRVENQTDKPLRVRSKNYFVSIEGAPTLDINNPDLIGKAEKKPIRSNKATVNPGEKLEYTLYSMAQFPGRPRLLSSEIVSMDGKKTYYKRAVFWELRKALMTAVYKDYAGLPYLNAGFYPSFGNKLRIACTFNKKLPCVKADVTVKNEAGKVLRHYTRGNGKSVIADFVEETALPGLPLGKYFIDMKAVGKDKKLYTHSRTFEVAKFPWQDLNIGKERVIVPPFKPLKHDKKKKEIHSLMTGYKLGKGLWTNIVAENEEIMAEPVQFYVKGEPLTTRSIKLVSAEKDRIVYDVVLAYKHFMTLTVRQEYDYDGFCKATVRVESRHKMILADMVLKIAMKEKYAEYYNVLIKSGARAKAAPDLRIPDGEGVLDLKADGTRPGRNLPYFWFGDNYKGFCFIIDSDKHFMVDRKKRHYRLERKDGKVTFTLDIFNKRGLLDKPFEIVFGFQPTPVKPQNEKFRRIGEKMYHYDEPAGCDFAPMAAKANVVSTINYAIGSLPNNDTSYYKHLFAHRNKKISDKDRIAFADAYVARNREWMEKHMPLEAPEILHRLIRDWRMYGPKYYLLYHNPALFSCSWPESEMYKAEWVPAAYAVDDAQNEYYSNLCDSYIDKLLYEMRRETRLGFDGMNFDCFPLGSGYNEIAGQAYRVRNGTVPYLHCDNMLRVVPQGLRSHSNLFKWRELCKRTAHMLYTEKRLTYGVPWVDLHATHGQAVPVTAFCATTITHERSSGGGEYFDRFPDSFVQADTLGTQSGIIPKTIVSTRGRGAKKEDELRTLIAFGFAYGLLNVFDQGVFIKSKDYNLSRNYPFTFGYGNPAYQTLPFHGRKPQPITCKNPSIRTTQVIRNDGRALLLIGNLGDETVAEFDVSKLNYGKYNVIDVFNQKELKKPSIKIGKRSYAMLEIRKIAD